MTNHAQRKAPAAAAAEAVDNRTYHQGLHRTDRRYENTIYPGDIVTLRIVLAEQLIGYRRRINTLINHLQALDAEEISLALHELAGELCDMQFPYLPESRQERIDNLCALAITVLRAQNNPRVSPQDLAAAAALIRYERCVIATMG